jgi:aerobic carbon-monoxide dehydrogenase small subunit
MKDVTITINGEAIKARLEPRLTLVDFLRDHRRLTGAHLACEQGVCGTCTVLLANEPVMESLRLAFKEEHALQCGFCTPGMLITARDIVLRSKDDDEKRVRTELAGNLCRCTGYMGIVSAVRRVIRERLAHKPA